MRFLPCDQQRRERLCRDPLSPRGSLLEGGPPGGRSGDAAPGGRTAGALLSEWTATSSWRSPTLLCQSERTPALTDGGLEATSALISIHSMAVATPPLSPHCITQYLRMFHHWSVRKDQWPRKCRENSFLLLPWNGVFFINMGLAKESVWFP